MFIRQDRNRLGGMLTSWCTSLSLSQQALNPAFPKGIQSSVGLLVPRRVEFRAKSLLKKGAADLVVLLTLLAQHKILNKISPCIHRYRQAFRSRKGDPLAEIVWF